MPDTRGMGTRLPLRLGKKLLEVQCLIEQPLVTGAMELRMP